MSSFGIAAGRSEEIQCFAKTSVVSKLYNEEQEREEGRAHTEELYRDKNLPDILHRSINFIAVNKGYDIKVNSNDSAEITVERQLCKMFPDLVDTECFHSFRFVHRLDYATSGVLCLALNKKAAAQVQDAFEQKTISKYYIALVRGIVQFKHLLIDVPIGKDKSKDWRGAMCTPDKPLCHKPRPASTLAVCMEIGMYDGKPTSKILLKPYTGRTHQLRVHCAYIGHTIVGDYTYSGREDSEPHRMMLHAHRWLSDLKCEKLDLTASDPFTNDIDTKWQPKELHSTYEEAMDFAMNTSQTNADVKVLSLTEVNSGKMDKPVSMLVNTLHSEHDNSGPHLNHIAKDSCSSR